MLQPDPLRPGWQLPTAQFALIDWAVNEQLARQQAQLVRCHQPACHLLLLLPEERSAVLAGLLLTATGYLAAPLCPTELLACFTSISLGNGYWNANLLTLLTGMVPARQTYPAGLNKREHELWDYLADGLTNRQLEEKMCLSASRVKNLKTCLAQKLNLPNAHHLTGQAILWRKHS